MYGQYHLPCTEHQDAFGVLSHLRKFVFILPFYYTHWSARDAFRETRGSLVVQDKDSRIVKDSVSTDKAG